MRLLSLALEEEKTQKQPKMNGSPHKSSFLRRKFTRSALLACLKWVYTFDSDSILLNRIVNTFLQIFLAGVSWCFSSTYCRVYDWPS